MGEIDLNNVVKVFGGTVRAVDGVSLTIEDGEFVVLVGPSGCGKSTLLRMIAGLEEVTEGVIAIDGKDVTDVSPRDRDIAMVFQNYALYPHMTVRGNLGYGLRVRGVAKEAIEQRVQEVARTLVLDELLHRRPRELSGGQRQRVAIGRAMAREPIVYLMDEPLSNLDAKLRVSMRAELARLHARLGVTTVYVTHDQVEAMTLGQRVAVMRDGVVQQIDRPQALYDKPVNLFVAAFIGSPSMNLATATVEGDRVKVGGVTISLDAAHRSALRDGPVIVGVRPEALSDAALEDASLPSFEAVADVTEELGSDVYVVFALDAPGVDSADLRAASDGERESLFADDRARFTARFDRRSRARAGATIRVAVDPATLYFFDPQTGELLGSPADTGAQTPADARAAAQ